MNDELVVDFAGECCCHLKINFQFELMFIFIFRIKIIFYFIRINLYWNYNIMNKTIILAVMVTSRASIE